jgi:hypothetical protein
LSSSSERVLAGVVDCVSPTRSSLSRLTDAPADRLRSQASGTAVEGGARRWSKTAPGERFAGLTPLRLCREGGDC